jgi:rhomboid protease GluP
VNINIKIQLNTLFFLLFFNLVIFALATLVQAGSGRAFDTEAFIAFGGLSAYDVIYEGKFWLLLTFNFFHLNIIHFILNMYALVRLGELINTYYGGRKLFITYILGGLAGGLLTVLVSYFYWITQDKPFVLSLGASASVFALVGVLFGGSLRKRRYGADFPFTTSDLLPVIAISLLFSLIPGINLWAHVGGLLMGIILGFVFSHTYGNVLSKSESITESVLYRLTQLIFIVSYFALIASFIKIV